MKIHSLCYLIFLFEVQAKSISLQNAQITSRCFDQMGEITTGFSGVEFRSLLPNCGYQITNITLPEFMYNLSGSKLSFVPLLQLSQPFWPSFLCISQEDSVIMTSWNEIGMYAIHFN